MPLSSVRSTSGRQRFAPSAGATAVLVGLLASGAMVWQSSYAAFSSTTSNATNTWAAGTVSLTDDDSGTVMFNASNLKPGNTATKCIAVTSTGSVPSTVKLYGTNGATTNALSSSINLTITQGTGGGTASCAGFTPQSTGSAVYTGTLSQFTSSATGFSSGLSTWAPTGTGSETKVFQLAWTLDAATPNSAQGGTAAVGFTWEAQS